MASSVIYLEENTEGIQPALPLPVAFSGGADPSERDIPVQSDMSLTQPSVSTGFPSIFSNPATSGKYITRQQMNGLWYLATANESRRQLGGINTYNPNLVSVTGGYSQGAILDWWDKDTKTIFKVISLVNKNTYNFIDNGPDGVKWKLCSPSVQCTTAYNFDEMQIIGKFANLSLPSSYGWISGTFVMPFDGYVLCNSAVSHSTTSVKLTFAEQVTWESTFYPPTEDNPTKSTADIKVYSIGTVSPEVVTAESYVNQRHEVFMAVCDEDEGEPIVDMENIGGGNNNCVLHMLSSSGMDGGGAPGPYLIPEGSIIRLFGRQGYDERAETESLPPANLYSAGNFYPTIVRNGGLTISMRLVAYPI